MLCHEVGKHPRESCGPATEPDTQPLSPIHPNLTRSMREIHSSDQKGHLKLSGPTLPAGFLTTQKCMQGVLHKSFSAHRHPSCPEIPKSGFHDNTAASVIYKCVCVRARAPVYVLLCVHSHPEMHGNKLLAQSPPPTLQTGNNLQGLTAGGPAFE